MIGKDFKIIVMILITLLISSFGYSQSNRSTLNNGVDKYDEKKYTDAEVEFRKVVENAPKSFEANYNLPAVGRVSQFRTPHRGPPAFSRRGRP